jgi:protein involved in polysaccharide export with SLBB domain|tara:strand:+ start:184 stop:381 length:198 start_codon:yes stop_codon:yes gene_type:complete
MTSPKNKVLEFKVGDWVDVRIVGIRDNEDPPYKIESIDGDECVVVQKEGSYVHRIKVSKNKLVRL